MKIINFKEIQEGIHKELISNKESFEVGLLDGHLSDAVTLIEREIESAGQSCRIYTSKRLATAAAGLLEAGLGVAALTAIAVHNMATYNPDWEICRYLIDKKLEVTYMK